MSDSISGVSQLFTIAQPSPLAAVSVHPLHQLEGYPLGTFEESKLPADVVHLIAEQFHPVGHQVAGRRLDIVDAERKVVVAASPQIRRVLTRIVRRPWIELEQLDLERGSAPSSASVMC